MLRNISFTVLAFLMTTVAHAQTSYPMVMSLKPVAVQVGTTAECEVHSRYTMLGTFQVFVSGTGVMAEAIAPEQPALKPGEKPKDVTKLKLKITAAADALPGVREFRLATPNGASTLGQLVIVRDPVVAEAADNNTRDKAQAVAFPATLCGSIEKAEDFDFYKFTAEAGQSLAFHVRAQRLEDKIHDLQNHIDPILFLRDAAGGVVAMSDNAFFADPFLSHTFAKAGEYFLEIRDVRYQGNVDWEYCIEVNSRPFVTQMFPLAVRPGIDTPIELSGSLIPTGITATVNPPSLGTAGFQSIPVKIGETTTNPVSVYVTETPITVVPAAENDAVAMAVPVTMPAVITGRIEKPSDLDVYAFPAKKGEKFSFEVLARRQQSQVDSYLRVLNEKEQTLKEDDDGRFGKLQSADTLIEGWEAPADGTYFVEMRDVHLRGGDGFGYVLKITPTVPTFDLLIDTDKTNLTPGTNGVLFVRANRKHSFKGDVELHVEGLPPGVTATCGRALTTKYPDGAIVLSAAPDAKFAASNLRIWGTAIMPQGEGQPPLEFSVEATPYQETYNPGGGRVHWPAEQHMVNVGAPNDLLAVTISETDIRLKPGESKKVAITVQRAPEMKANVVLDLTFNHLEQIFASSLPDGISIDSGNSKTLLSNGATEGYITIKADKAAPPVEKQLTCVMANLSINFVMKATYASAPLWISVDKVE